MGGTDKSSTAGSNLNELHRAKGTNMPFSAYSFTSHCSDAASLDALGVGPSQRVTMHIKDGSTVHFNEQDMWSLAGAFAADKTPLGDAWNQIVLGGPCDQSDIAALQAEVAKTVQGAVVDAEVPEVSQAIAELAVSIREQRKEADEMIRRTIRKR